LQPPVSLLPVLGRQKAVVSSFAFGEERYGRQFSAKFFWWQAAFGIPG